MTEATEGTESDAPATLLEVGRSALGALIELVPRALWRGIKGAFLGSFLLGLLGLLLAGVGALATSLELLSLPRWLVITNLLWVPTTFFVAGGYTGALYGFLSCLSEEIEERGLAARMYAVIKPVCLTVAKKARQGAGADLGADLKEAMEEGLADKAETRPPTLGERIQVFLASQSRRILLLSVLRIVVTAKDKETALAELETFGVRQLGQWLGDTVEDLFAMQVAIAASLALLAASLPALVYAITN